MTDEIRLDDTARYYLAVGVVEDKSEIRACVHCGASVMAWYLRCEGCGSYTPFTPLPENWICGWCGGEHESERDAEECCAVWECSNYGCQVRHWTEEEAGECAGPNAA